MLDDDACAARAAAAPRLEALASAAAPLALVAGSLASGSCFQARAALGETQLRLHERTPDGLLSVGGLPERLDGEGGIAGRPEVLAREPGPERAPAAPHEAGRRGGCWEIERGVGVLRFLRPFVGRRAMLERARASPVSRGDRACALALRTGRPRA